MKPHNILIFSLIILSLGCVGEHPNKDYTEWKEMYRISESGDTFYVGEPERYTIITWHSDRQGDFFIDVLKDRNLVYSSEFSYGQSFSGVCNENPGTIETNLGLYLEINQSHKKADFSSVLFSGDQKNICYPKIVTQQVHP